MRVRGGGCGRAPRRTTISTKADQLKLTVSQTFQCELMEKIRIA